MRRLPFALAAIAGLLPLIACLQNADNGDESSADIDDQAKQSCNFAFTEVTQPASQKIARASAKGVANGQALLFGDFTGDGNPDFLVASAANEVRLWQGDGAGHFAARGVTTIPTDDDGPLAGRTLTALATVATGDFDGDKNTDAILMVTSVAAPAAGVAPDVSTTTGTLVVLYGKGAAAGTDGGAPSAATFDVVAQPNTHNVTASSFELVGDLDGDGIDDFVHVSAKDDDISFGSTDRMLVPSDTHWMTTATRGLAYVTPKSATSAASLLIAGSKKSISITFDAQRKATLVQGAGPTFTSADSRSGTDLDQDHSPEITILGNNTLSIAPVSAAHGKPVSFANVAGHLVGAQDLDGNKSTELLFANDDKLMAACGYSATTTALAVVELPVPYPTNGFVAGEPDLDNDGHPDLVTMTNDGVLHAYRNTGRNATAPALKVLAATVGATADAGAGTDAATNVDPSASDAAAPGVDGGAGDASTTDAGTTTPNATTATGTEETEPPAQEGSGEASYPHAELPPSVPRATEDDGTTPAATAPAAASSSGCATAPGERAPLGFPALVLGALVVLATRRRRR